MVGFFLLGIEETNGGLVVFGGGFPLYQGGYLVGAIGVSGGTVPQDEEVATAGLVALPEAETLTLAVVAAAAGVVATTTTG